MRFDILTIFPEFFVSPLNEGMVRRALRAEQIRVAVHNKFEMRQQGWAKITLHTPDGVEVHCARQVLQPLNNCWTAAAEAEFVFNADQYPGAKLELLVDVQLEGRHSYQVVKVVLARK